MWLIVDKESALAKAVKIAARKHKTTQASVKRMVQSILPKDFFSKRAKANMSPELKAAIREKKINEWNAKKAVG